MDHNPYTPPTARVADPGDDALFSANAKLIESRRARALRMITPHGGLVFSPWTRDRPGIDDFPRSAEEFLGSIAFLALLGGLLGFAFWYFYSRGPRMGLSVVHYRPRRPRISGSGDTIDSEDVSR